MASLMGRQMSGKSKAEKPTEANPNRTGRGLGGTIKNRSDENRKQSTYRAPWYITRTTKCFKKFKSGFNFQYTI